MRWLLRLVLFWVVSGSLFYIFGLPFALEKLTAKARDQSYTQCMGQLAHEGMIGGLHSPLKQEQGEHYCHCLSDGLTFTKNDLFDAAQGKVPAGLTALAQTLADKCNAELQAAQNPTASETPANAETPKADSNVLYF
jgi:hypothetical protein